MIFSIGPQQFFKIIGTNDFLIQPVEWRPVNANITNCSALFIVGSVIKI